MAILSKVRKLYNFESCLGFTFVDYGSFLELIFPNLALCETNLDDSIDFNNFFMNGYLPLIQKDFVTGMHDLAFYTNVGLPFACDLFINNPEDFSYVFNWVQPVSYFFFLYRSPSSFSTVFHAVS